MGAGAEAGSLPPWFAQVPAVYEYDISSRSRATARKATAPRMGDGAALIARIDAAERATLLSRQRVAELESTKKGAQLDLGKLSAANTQQQHVCRELQQAMKALGGGEGSAEDDEAARREELARKFDGTLGDIGDIGERMGEQEAEVERLVADNERSLARLASFRAQHEAVLKHQAAEAHTRELQARLAAARLREAWLGLGLARVRVG